MSAVALGTGSMVGGLDHCAIEGLVAVKEVRSGFLVGWRSPNGRLLAVEHDDGAVTHAAGWAHLLVEASDGRQGLVVEYVATVRAWPRRRLVATC